MLRWLWVLIVITAVRPVEGIEPQQVFARIPSPKPVHAPWPPVLTSDAEARKVVPCERLGLAVHALSDGEAARSQRVLRAALKRYPPGFLPRFVRRILVVGRLSFFGVDVGGTYHRDTVLIANYGAREGSTDQWLVECLHHEISSVLLHARTEKFPHRAWRDALPGSFRYGKGGFEAVRDGQADERELVSELSAGFACEYGRAAFEEDFNTIAERVLARPAPFAKLCRAHPRLEAKRKLVVRFYKTLDPRFKFAP